MQSIEEAAREIYLLYKEKDRVLSEGVLIGFMKGVEFAQQWISVKDELPKKGDRVLLKDKDGEIECLLIYNEDYVTLLMERFTHWRYLELK